MASSLDIEAIDWDGMPDRLRAGMTRRRLSHRRFAALAGVSTATVTNWLGGTQMKHDRWPRVANSLGMSVEELLGQATATAHVDPLPREAGDADKILKRLAGLAAELESLSRAVPDLMQVLREAQRYAEDEDST